MQIKNLDDLYAALKSGAIELTEDLPTFTKNGFSIHTTEHVWSYEYSRVLVGNSIEVLRLELLEDEENIACYPNEKSAGKDASLTFGGVEMPIRIYMPKNEFADDTGHVWALWDRLTGVRPEDIDIDY